MIFNSKQLEELENIHDSTGAFEEEADDDSGFDDVGEAAMDWRRGLIEEAAESVKRAKTRPVDPSIQYSVGSLLFDRDARRFGRVQKSIPGYLKIVYLSGGDREYGTLDVIAYLKEHGAQKRVSEMSEQLGMADADVSLELERLGITPLEEPDPVEEPQAEEPAAAAPAPAPVAPRIPKPPRGRPRFEEDDEDGEDEDEDLLADDDVDEDLDSSEGEALDDEDLDLEASDDEEVEVPKNGGKQKGKAAQKASAKAPAPAPAKKGKAPEPQKAVAKAVDKRPPEKKGPDKGAEKKAAPKNEKKPEKPAAKAPAPKAEAGKKAKGVNPIDDPNGFIRANFQTMSNRELARLTGLSEHTIRRKLGEWGMKRKKGEE